MLLSPEGIAKERTVMPSKQRFGRGGYEFGALELEQKTRKTI